MLHVALLRVLVFLGLLLPSLALAQEADVAATAAPAQTTEALPAAPVEVYAGAYVLRLSNVSPRDGSFDVDMWVWFRWKGDAVDPVNTFELANGTIEVREVNPQTKDGDYNYSTARVQATVFHDFDVRRFPMDDHVITIHMEDKDLVDARLRYIADTGSALDPSVNVAGWDVRMLQPEVAPHVYATDYGLRETGKAASVYSRLTIPVELTRTGYGVLFKSFWISALAVLLGLLAFLVKADDLDARFGMGVGSIFAASANSFVISDSLPQTTAVTLAEQINLIAVGIIFLSVFISIWSLRLRYAERDEASIALDRWSMLGLGVAYVVMNVVVFIFDLS